MTVSSFIKENRVLVAGLTLPLLLIGLLAFAKTINNSLTPPPQHKVMYSIQTWGTKGSIAIEIDDDGHLTPVFTKTAQQYPSTGKDTPPKTMIYYFDATKNIVEEESVTLDKNGKVTPLEKFKDVKLSKQATSPEGYVFQDYYMQSNSLITDIFSYRGYSTGPAISNKGRVILIPRNSVYYGTPEFLGWEK